MTAPTEQTCGCGRTIPADPPAGLVTAGGWCAPAETTYIPEQAPLCSDCKSRMMMMTVGIDPGRDGENLRCPPRRHPLPHPGLRDTMTAVHKPWCNAGCGTAGVWHYMRAGDTLTAQPSPAIIPSSRTAPLDTLNHISAAAVTPIRSYLG